MHPTRCVGKMAHALNFDGPAILNGHIHTVPAAETRTHVLRCSMDDAAFFLEEGRNFYYMDDAALRTGKYEHPLLDCCRRRTFADQSTCGRCPRRAEQKMIRERRRRAPCSSGPEL